MPRRWVDFGTPRADCRPTIETTTTITPASARNRDFRAAVVAVVVVFRGPRRCYCAQPLHCEIRRFPQRKRCGFFGAVIVRGQIGPCPVCIACSFRPMALYWVDPLVDDHHHDHDDLN